MTIGIMKLNSLQLFYLANIQSFLLALKSSPLAPVHYELTHRSVYKLNN